MKRAISFLISLVAAVGPWAANAYLLFIWMSTNAPSRPSDYVAAVGLGAVLTLAEGLFLWLLWLIWKVSEDLHRKLWGGKP